MHVQFTSDISPVCIAVVFGGHGTWAKVVSNTGYSEYLYYIGFFKQFSMNKVGKWQEDKNVTST